MHEHQTVVGHYADGSPILETTGFTIVTRESAWDEGTRERVFRLAEYRASLCPCGCGVPVDKAWDPFFEPWAVDKFTCYARRALLRVQRTWEDQHKDEKGKSWADGVEHFVVAPEGAAHNEEAAAAADARKRGTSGN